MYVWGDNRHSQCGLPGQDFTNPALLPTLLGKNVVGVACGGVHSVVVCADGAAYAWGVNTKFQCGVTQPSLLASPTLVLNYVKGVAAGLAHTLVLTDSGSVKASGWNNCGQLGVGHTRDSAFIELDLKDIVHLSCGGAHSLAVSKEGNLFGTGSNSCGQLGLGHNTDMTSFTFVDRLQNQVSYSACGEEYSIAVTHQGQCYTFGNLNSGLGNVGQLGDGRDNVRESPELLALDEPIYDLHCSKTQVLATSKSTNVFSWGSWKGAPNPPNLVTNLRQLRTHQVRASREQFYLITKYAEPQRCYLNDLPVAGMIAGVTHNFTLELIDGDGLFVTVLQDSVQCVAVSETGRATLAQSQFVRGKHMLSLKLSEAGTYHIYGLVNSNCVRFAPYIARVKPGLVAAAVAYISVQSDSETLYRNAYTVHAGSKLSIELESKDAYDNICDVPVSSRDLTLLLDENPLQFSLESTSLSRNLLTCTVTRAGSFALKLLFRTTEVKCIYQRLVVEEGINRINEVATKSDVNIRVFPGMIEPSNCSVSKVSLAQQVGEVWAWVVVHNDKYSNQTWHKLEDFQISFEISGVYQPLSQELAVDYCSTHITSRPVTAGRGRLLVKYNNSFICEKECEVMAGPPSPAHCKAYGEGLQPTYINRDIELERSFKIELRDRFDNLTASSDILVTVQDYEGHSCRPQLQETSCVYSVSRPGAYCIDLLVNHERLPGFPFSINIARDPQEVEAEQREEHLRLLLEERRRAEEQAAAREKLESEAKAAVELKKQLEIRRKAAEDALKAQARQKADEELELEKRRRIVEKLKRQEETERRAAEALEKLRAMKAETKPKARRTGGGFLLIEP